MGIIDAVIFDLDDTLVDSSKLQCYRETRDFSGLQGNLHLSKLFPPVEKLLGSIRSNGTPVALVTNSPKWYAEEVLNFHGINNFDVKVYYDDVGSGGIKPSGRGILLAIDRLGLTVQSNIIYIGDQDTDYIASYNAGIKPVALTWVNRVPISQIPAVIINSNKLLESLNDYDELALIAERVACNRSFNFPMTQLNFMPLNDKGELVPLKREDIKLITFGRYFSQNSTLTAKLHEGHPLSKAIFEKETVEGYIVPTYFVDLLTRVVETLPPYIFESDTRNFDIISVIPSKSGKIPRLESMLFQIEQRAETVSLFINDLFLFSEGAESLKTMGGKSRRMQELQQHLTINPKYRNQLQNKSVLILDDVITTGATFNHAFYLLKRENVSFFFGVCLAKTVSVKEDDKLCPECNRLMRVRTQKNSGIHFFGCTGYAEKVNKCSYTEDIVVKPCPQCGDGLITKYNQHRKQLFLACKSYNKDPKCNYTESMNLL